MSNNNPQISMNEHLSALLDDEVGSFEERRVLDELKSDSDLSKKLSNYALIGETMRTGESQQPALLLGSSFLDNIHQQIELEDQFDEVILEDVNTSQSASNSAEKNSILRPIGGFAVAASVGALAFMGLQNVGVINAPTNQPSNIVDSSGPIAIAQTEPVSTEKTNTESNNTTSNSEIVSTSNQYVDADLRTRMMLKRYVDSHMQYANTSTFVPSVRVIAYTDNQ